MKRAFGLSILICVFALGHVVVDGADNSRKKLLNQIQQLQSQLSEKDREIQRLKDQLDQERRANMKLQVAYNDITDIKKEQKLQEIKARQAYREQKDEIIRAQSRAMMLEKFRILDSTQLPSRCTNNYYINCRYLPYTYRY